MDRNELDFRLVACHPTAPLGDVVSSLGSGSLQLEAGERSVYGDRAAETTWVSQLFNLKGSPEWSQPLAWLEDHREAIKSLVEFGWTIQAELRIIARQPIVLCPLPVPFIDWLAKSSVPFQVVVYPRPILLDTYDATGSEP